jgi:hypothetical protein
MLQWMQEGMLGTLLNTKAAYEDKLGKKVAAFIPKNNLSRKIQQRTYYKEIDEATWKLDKTRRIAKMSRWNLRLHNHKLVPRMNHFLQKAAALLPPKIRSAVFCTWWNRTCTARRFQKNVEPWGDGTKWNTGLHV